MSGEKSKKINKQKTRKMSLRFKILIPVSILILIICCGMGISSYFSTNSGMVNMGVDQANMAASIALESVNGDKVANISAGSEDSDDYKAIL